MHPCVLGLFLIAWFGGTAHACSATVQSSFVTLDTRGPANQAVLQQPLVRTTPIHRHDDQFPQQYGHSQQIHKYNDGSRANPLRLSIVARILTLHRRSPSQRMISWQLLALPLAPVVGLEVSKALPHSANDLVREGTWLNFSTTPGPLQFTNWSPYYPSDRGDYNALGEGWVSPL